VGLLERFWNVLKLLKSPISVGRGPPKLFLPKSAYSIFQKRKAVNTWSSHMAPPLPPVCYDLRRLFMFPISVGISLSISESNKLKTATQRQIAVRSFWCCRVYMYVRFAQLTKIGQIAYFCRNFSLHVAKSNVQVLCVFEAPAQVSFWGITLVEKKKDTYQACSTGQSWLGCWLPGKRFPKVLVLLETTRIESKIEEHGLYENNDASLPPVESTYACSRRDLRRGMFP
jgi:hypothetical protein